MPHAHYAAIVHYFPAQLRAWRKSLDLTQENLARILGTTKTTIWFWETGRSRPSPVFFAALKDRGFVLKPNHSLAASKPARPTASADST